MRADGVLKAATSTGVDGVYLILLSPNGVYHLAAGLALFSSVERDVTTSASPCDVTVDFQLALKPRDRTPSGVASGAGRGGQSGARDQAARRFETLNVQSDASGAATLEATSPVNDAEMLRLLPPGFSIQTAAGDAVALNGSGDAATLDRGLLNDRLQAIGRGEFDPATGEFAPGFGPPGFGPGGFGPGGGPGGGFGGGRGGGPGGPGGGFGRGGFDPGGFALGGRGGRGQSAYQGSATYTFGGSALDTAPYQLRADVPAAQPQFAQNTFGATVGGPFKIPGLYDDTNRRSTFQLNYLGNRSNNVFDQYATVPTDAMRAGDFSGSQITLIDPQTGIPFQNNQIPFGRMNAGSLSLLRFIPMPNLPGASQNYHLSTTSHSSSDDLSLRFTQNLSPTMSQGGRGGFGGGRGGGGGGRGGPGGFGFGGRPGGPGRGTSIVLSEQLQIRHNENDSPNVFSSLSGQNSTTSITAPLSLNIVHGRSLHNITVNVTHSSTRTSSPFSDVEDVAGEAGIDYPDAASADPLNWGVPNLTFSTFSDARSVASSARSDNRLTTSYAWGRGFGRHQVRIGADYRLDSSTSQSNANARGSYTFTGLHTSPGSQVAGRSGADFADFLLGLPQQATLQVGGVTHLRGQSFSGYVDDNWRANARLTLNLGLRYELVLPYTETNGRMANLDVTPDFTAAAAVVAGGTAPFTGQFPAGLVKADTNNLGPRVGVAYRLANGTIVRGGYSVTYNNGSYAAIARQLSSQPPFAQTATVLGSAQAPLFLQTALLSSTSTTTNNWGVDKNYQLGNIQTWNAALNRDLSKNWSVLLGYTGTKGTDLDILRAPNRGPTGLRIHGVQAFIWESSGGHSLLNSGTFQVRRRLAKGFAASASYTLAKSMDNASSLGAGGAVVAQNDQDLDAEWALSNFDRRHQFSSQALWELPIGANRRWLANGGMLAGLFGNWSISTAVTYQSGSPFTARVIGATSDVSRGTNGSLRANYSGAAIVLDSPTIAQFFNTAAFLVPAPGTFGNSARNIIIGPAAHQLNASLIRDLRLGGNRTMTLGINAVNLLNTVQWTTIDTNLNSPTFGQVLSVRPMRTVTATLRVRF